MTDNKPEIDILTGEQLAQAIPAATLVIFRDQPGQTAPDLLMVERSSKMAFAAGAAVFPGGRVDAADYEYAAMMGHKDIDEYGARIAAIRESIEETGIAVGVEGDLTVSRILEARKALETGTIFQEICKSFDWQPDLESLIPFTRWRPPFAERRIFDTRFYMVRHDDHDAEAVVDQTENYNLFWSNANTVLQKADKGDVRIIFPTRRNLERLAQFSSFAEAKLDAEKFPVTLVSPMIEERRGEMHLCIPDDIGYPVTSESFESVKRG